MIPEAPHLLSLLPIRMFQPSRAVKVGLLTAKVSVGFHAEHTSWGNTNWQSPASHSVRCRSRQLGRVLPRLAS